MNPKINKITAEIEKIKEKIDELQSRLKELEGQKTELENVGIVALVRGVDIPPAELEAFIKAYMERKDQLAPEIPVSGYVADDINSDEKEDYGACE